MLYLCVTFLVWFLLLSAFTLTLSLYHANNSGESSNEKEAIENAERVVSDFLLYPKKRNSFLISTFINASRTNSFRIWSINLAIARTADVDVAVVFYDGDFNETSRFCNISGYKDRIKHCERALISYDERLITVPKPLLYPDLLPYLKMYERVMLIDEDISLSEWNMTHFVKVWTCAFSPPPIIVQGLIFEGTQAFGFLNAKTWRRKDLNSVLASATAFVEQQIPAFNSAFFYWFVKFVLPAIFPSMIERQSGWGIDFTWCGAASAFARSIYQITERDYVSCALITSGGFFHHMNGKSIRSKYESQEVLRKFRIDSAEQMLLWKRSYPSWFRHFADATLPSFRKALSLNESC